MLHQKLISFCSQPIGMSFVMFFCKLGAPLLGLLEKKYHKVHGNYLYSEQKLIKIFAHIIVIFSTLFLLICTQDKNDSHPLNNSNPVHNRTAPEAEAGPDTSVGINDSIILQGTGIDSGGTIVKYEWKFGNSGWVETSTGYTIIIAPSTAQSFVCSLRVTNNYGLTGTDYVTIEVTSFAPIVKASANKTVRINDSISLFGVGLDADGYITKYEWKIGNNDWVAVSTGDTFITAPSTAQIYICSLRVTDDDGLTGIKNVTIMVTSSDTTEKSVSDTTVEIDYDNKGPAITLVKPEKDSTRVNKSSLSVTVNCTDSSGVRLVICTIHGKNLPVNKIGNNSYTIDVTGLNVGENILIFTAVDSSSNINISNMSLTVFRDPTMEDSEGPVLELKEPGKNNSIVKTSSVKVTVICTDKSGVKSVTCTFNNNQPLVVTKAGNNSYTVDVTGLTVGENTLTFIAVDSSSNKNTSKKIVTVVYYSEVSSQLKIAAGGRHSLFIKPDGTLWACGNNYYGQLGYRTINDYQISTPIQIMNSVQSTAAGNNHTLILRTDGTLWTCGDNKYGQLGDGTTSNLLKPVQINF